MKHHGTRGFTLAIALSIVATGAGRALADDGTITVHINGASGTPGDVLTADREHGLIVRTGDGILAVERVQPQFKKPQDWRSFLNGHPDVVGSRLGT